MLKSINLESKQIIENYVDKVLKEVKAELYQQSKMTYIEDNKENMDMENLDNSNKEQGEISCVKAV